MQHDAQKKIAKALYEQNKTEDHKFLQLHVNHEGLLT